MQTLRLCCLYTYGGIFSSPPSLLVFRRRRRRRRRKRSRRRRRRRNGQKGRQADSTYILSPLIFFYFSSSPPPSFLPSLIFLPLWKYSGPLLPPIFIYMCLFSLSLLLWFLLLFCLLTTTLFYCFRKRDNVSFPSIPLHQVKYTSSLLSLFSPIPFFPSFISTHRYERRKTNK